ncbi:MAG: type VI secretion system domain-containing protein [Nannocystaceae bacterium]
MDASEARTRAAGLLEPFQGGSPAGTDPKRDARARALGDAMLLEPIVRRPWPEILRDSEALLREVGKDLRIAGFWATAAYEVEGLGGLACGLALLDGLLRERWEDMTPRRPRARESALANLYEHLAARLPAHPATGDDEDATLAEAIALCRALLEELHAAASERFAPPPMPRQARAELERLAADHPQAAPREGPGGAPTAPPAAEAPVPSAAGGASASAPSDADGRGPAPVVADRRHAPDQEDRQSERDRDRDGAARAGAAEAPAPKASSARARASAVGLPPIEAPKDGDDVEPFVRSLSQGLLRAASALRQSDSADPLAYRLCRVAIWLRAAPPPSAGGATELAGVAPGDRRRFDAMLQGRRWAPLLDAAESALRSPLARFQLDLHRYVAAALAGMPGHDAARQAVLAELAGLLTRMPELPSLRDRDGAPLADPETRQLLAAELGRASTSPESDRRAPTDAKGSPPAPSQESADADDADERAAARPTSADATSLAAAVAAARAQSVRGEPHAAVAALQRRIVHLGSPRERFCGRLELAHLCLDAGLRPVAAALFAALDDEARARGLDTWEPSLAAAALAGRLKALDDAARADEGRDALFARLCAVDPGAAARLSTH